ncbi:MAG: methyltransferase domain-containing protein [Balneolaceae bacterium]
MEIIEHRDINKVAEAFGKAAAEYHQEARIQRKVAKGLISSLRPWTEIIPPGPILEAGCGTGFLTRLLIEQFPERELIITDASAKMLQYCESTLREEGLLRDNIRFQLLDVDTSKLEKNQHSLVISSFAPQWFKDTAVGLEKLAESVKPGGLLLCAFPGNNSFPQWYENCLELGLPHTANPLPDVEEVVIKLSIGPLQIDYYENDLFDEFDSSLDFFRHLKTIGASESTLNKSLSAKQFRLLVNHWDSKEQGKIKVKWHIVYLAAQKDFTNAN